MEINVMKPFLAIVIINFLTFQSVSLEAFGHNKSRRISEIKCDEYFKKSKNSMMTNSLLLIPASHSGIEINPCLFSQGIIIGGENAKAGEFPHMAAIGYENLNNEINFNCGGSLISEQHVITAAHCSYSDGIKPTLVRLGDLNLKLKEEYLPEIDILIADFISHEKYVRDEENHDIAVIKLAKTVTFSKYIRPACLATPEMNLENKKAIATGWGLTEALTTRFSDHLKKVELSIIDDQACRQISNNDTNIGDTKLCAGELGGKSSSY
jgi:secreted trypsin-like serine protease